MVPAPAAVLSSNNLGQVVHTIKHYKLVAANAGSQTRDALALYPWSHSVSCLWPRDTEMEISASPWINMTQEGLFIFLLCDTMLAWYMLSSRVCLSVCLSHAGIVSKKETQDHAN